MYEPMDMDSGTGWAVGVGMGCDGGGQKGKNWDNCNRTNKNKIKKYTN